eukprot:TRINITY_DN20400_c0_g2_i1.p1 TRINITY_DN20400_c0_g2~~TRINITY_DN20400_c0_g2_i1.p1  ORF type:complete len:851 (-),score=159.31 TRINITY_DN20400_c0_g2_i1:113-2665(-)
MTSELAKQCLCGNVFASDALYCRMCGLKRPYKDKCLECGNTFLDDSVYCRKCGAKRPEKDKCLNCSNIYTEDSIYCRMCGVKRPEPKGTSDEVIKTLPTAPPKPVPQIALLEPIPVLERDDGTGSADIPMKSDAVDLPHRSTQKTPPASTKAVGADPVMAAKEAADAARRAGGYPSEIALAAGSAAADSARADGKPPAENGTMAASAAKTHGGCPPDVAKAAGDAASKAAQITKRPVSEVAKFAADAARAAGGSDDDVCLAAADAAAEAAIAAGKSPSEVGKAAADAVKAAGGTPQHIRKAAAAAAARAAVAAGKSPAQVAKSAADAAKKFGATSSELACLAGDAAALAAMTSGKSPSEVGKAAAVSAKAHGGSQADVTKAAADGAARAAIKAKHLPADVAKASSDAAKAEGGSPADLAKAAADSAARAAIAAGHTPSEAGKVVETVLKTFSSLPSVDTPVSDATATVMAPVLTAQVAQIATATAVAAPTLEAQVVQIATTTTVTLAQSSASIKSKSEEALHKLEQHGQHLEDKYGSLFDKIDTSGDGQLSHDELKAYVAKTLGALKELGVKSVDAFIREADTDGDGEVSRDEFQAYFTYVNLDKDACYNALFDGVDVDGSGDLTFQEVRDYPWYKNPKLCQILGIVNWHSTVAGLPRMDKNKDGKISREEFVSYLKAQQENNIGNAWAQAVSSDSGVKKPEAAWKQARANPVYQKGSGKGKKRKADDDFNKCWDFAAGYCYRGKRCHYTHDQTSQVDQKTLDQHHAHCVRVAKEAGINLNKQAMNELQTLTAQDAENLLWSLGDGGANEHVWDKSGYVIHNARRFRMQAGSKAHPDWEWYHGKNKRARW